LILLAQDHLEGYAEIEDWEEAMPVDPAYDLHSSSSSKRMKV